MRSFIKKHYILLTILAVAFAIRIYGITNTPPSLNWDEVSHGYNAYSILQTGKDEWGNTSPIIFRAYGDYKLPVYIYATASSILLFGLNVFAVRLPSALAGVATVIFTYLLVFEIFKSHKSKVPEGVQVPYGAGKSQSSIAVLSALLVAISPWSFFLSRGAFEANLALFFFTSGSYFFIKGLKDSKFLILNSLFFGLSVWTYNSYRIFTPMMLTVLWVIFRKRLLRLFKNDRKLTARYIIVTAFFLIPMFIQLLNPQGQARYGEVVIIDEGAIGQIIDSRQKSRFSPLITRLLFNRPTYFVNQFVENYVSHFSGNFLFFEGGSNYQFNVPGHGLLYWINIPFLLIGVVNLLRRRDRTALIILTWFYIAPIPSSLTREAPHVLRAITMLPIPMIISALGLVTFVNWSSANIGKRMLVLFRKYWFLPKAFNKVDVWVNRKNTLYLTYVLILILIADKYTTTYFRDYRKEYSWSWQYGYEEVVNYVKANYDKYDKIVVTKKYGEPHEFFLFYWPWSPEKYLSDSNLIRFNQSNWYWVDRFDKFYFVNDWEISENNDWTIPKSIENKDSIKLESGMVLKCEVFPDEIRPFIEFDTDKCLLITSPGNVPDDWKKLDTINFLDGQPAFEIYEN